MGRTFQRLQGSLPTNIFYEASELHTGFTDRSQTFNDATEVEFSGLAKPWHLASGLAWIAVSFAVALIFLSPAAYALTKEEENTIAIYRKVAPSIVNITTKVCESDYFFCAVPSEGSGSGIIIKADGTIVTNYHVVADSENIEVGLDDGRRFKARVIGKSLNDDLAIIKINPEGRALSVVSFGSPKDLKTGEKLLAIGNPFGLGQTLTVGTVSMVGRDIKSGGHTYRQLIQTDAPINPGNSGGALVDSGGQVIGMSTMILSPTGSNIGIGFGIPANRIQEALPGIMNPWKHRLSWVLVIALMIWVIRRIYRSQG